MSFNWPDFYSAFASGAFLLVMGSLVAVLFGLNRTLKDFPEFKKNTIDTLKSHEDRLEVFDNINTQHLGTIVRSEMIAQGKMAYPSKKWAAARDET